MLEVLTGDALERLRELPDGGVHCVCTSPPYWGLRDYGTAAWEGGEEGCDHFKLAGGVNSRNLGKSDIASAANVERSSVPFRETCGKCGARRIDSQLGLEKTPEEYVAKMVEVFREVRRVLRKDGTLWLNLGDSYAAGKSGRDDSGDNGRFAGPRIEPKQRSAPPGFKPKDLCGIPWRVAFALQADGWWLRSDIIWAKPNPMPESVTDRPTKSHEYLFLLTKSANYFYDTEAIKEKSQDEHERQIPAGFTTSWKFKTTGEHSTGRLEANDKVWGCHPNGRNKRSVWTVATAPYPEAHFATYPPDLIKPCIMAGTSAKGCCAKCGAPWERIVEREVHTSGDGRKHIAGGDRTIGQGWEGVPRATLTTETLGWKPSCYCEWEDGITEWTGVIPCTVLDPFAGSGTTGAVALELGRKAILIELNPKYIELIEQRCNITPGLALA